MFNLFFDAFTEGGDCPIEGGIERKGFSNLQPKGGLEDQGRVDQSEN